MSGVLVTDLKQWAYCQRIVYYRQVMPGIGKPTFKMEEAGRAQELIESLELRRTIQKYGLENARRRFGVWLADEEVGLSGRVDLLLEGDNEACVVDFKLTAGEPGENHRMQLSGYALLVERALGLRVRRTFLYRIPDGRVFEVAMEAGWAERVKGAVAAIRRACDAQVLPERTVVGGRCVECEYQNYCGDVW
jgi:CRISPR-associated exonuclease Cas4